MLQHDCPQLSLPSLVVLFSVSVTCFTSGLCSCRKALNLLSDVTPYCHLSQVCFDSLLTERPYLTNPCRMITPPLPSHIPYFFLFSLYHVILIIFYTFYLFPLFLCPSDPTESKLRRQDWLLFVFLYFPDTDSQGKALDMLVKGFACFFFLPVPTVSTVAQRTPDKQLYHYGAHIYNLSSS